MLASALRPVVPGADPEQLQAGIQMLQDLGVSRLHLLHVMESGLGRRSAAESWLERQARQLSGNLGISVDWSIREGHAGAEIARAAEDEDLDFIAIPSASDSRLRQVLLGSTARDVTRLAAKPVLVLKRLERRPGSFPFEHILFATDFGEAAERALPLVRDLSRPAQRLYILHVRRRAADPDTDQQRYRASLKEISRVRRALDLPPDLVQAESSVGSPHRLILKRSQQVGASLVIMGRFNVSPLQRIMGSTAEMVSSNTRVCMFLVP